VLLNYHIGRVVLCSMCVGVSVWLGWSGIRLAGFSLSGNLSRNSLLRWGGGGVGVPPLKEESIKKLTQ
jgi:hypothetical protein